MLHSTFVSPSALPSEIGGQPDIEHVQLHVVHGGLLADNGGACILQHRRCVLGHEGEHWQRGQQVPER